MAFELSIRSNSKQITQQIGTFVEKQVKFATARAMNDCIQDCRNSVPNTMYQVFRNPVPRTLNALRYKAATKGSLTASLWINDDPGKGIAPAKYLAAEISGGSRHQKRFERALQLRGLMPYGAFAVPAESVPRDVNGNVPASFYVLLLSYFGAFGEQGYRANMTVKRKAKLAGIMTSAGGYKNIGGVMYFIVSGTDRRTRHLKPGIYAKRGTHGSDIEPIFLFVPSTTYKPRFDFEKVVMQTFDKNFNNHMTQRLKDAVATAR